jgi:RNAse (barnase) inhibitor barstar
VEDWADLFGSYLDSGVYPVKQGSETAIKNAAKVSALDFTRVDLKGIAGKTGFLKKSAGALGFPAYFGMNWDAFSDCLTDMAWKPAAGYVILFDNYQFYATKAPSDAEAARRVLDSAAQYWQNKKVPFYVILRDRVTRGSSP